MKTWKAGMKMRIKIIKDAKNDFKELTVFLDKYNQTNYKVENDTVIYLGNLDLAGNQLTSLPESFGNLEVKGILFLGNNKLTSLPESFGNLKVGGYLDLYNNKLTSLPESFGNLKIGGDLYLSNNRLTSLPESFGNLEADGGLYLHNNQLTSLPESFGELKFSRLWLLVNPLKVFPKSIINIPLDKIIIEDIYKQQIQNMKGEDTDG